LGISIYDFKNFYNNFREFKFDVVQCPFNIFDQRLINDGHLKKLKKLKLKIHVRSIFLQGLLINIKFKDKVKFKKYKKFLDKYFSYLDILNIKPLDLCLNFVFKYKYIDKIIVGINSKKQLEQILNFKQIRFKNYDLFNYSHKKQLIDPRRW
jgi:aryl-alcohol dehydrogenase-like predicted oxidoreductase